MFSLEGFYQLVVTLFTKMLKLHPLPNLSQNQPLQGIKRHTSKLLFDIQLNPSERSAPQNLFDNSHIKNVHESNQTFTLMTPIQATSVALLHRGPFCREQLCQAPLAAHHVRLC